MPQCLPLTIVVEQDVVQHFYRRARQTILDRGVVPLVFLCTGIDGDTFECRKGGELEMFLDQLFQ